MERYTTDSASVSWWFDREELGKLERRNYEKYGRLDSWDSHKRLPLEVSYESKLRPEDIVDNLVKRQKNW